MVMLFSLLLKGDANEGRYSKKKTDFRDTVVGEARCRVNENIGSTSALGRNFEYR